jgi:hypothetical protein
MSVMIDLSSLIVELTVPCGQPLPPYVTPRILTYIDYISIRCRFGNNKTCLARRRGFALEVSLGSRHSSSERKENKEPLHGDGLDEEMMNRRDAM